MKNSSLTINVEADTAASLFSCDAQTLKRALTYRSISTGVGKRGSIISVPLDAQQVNSPTNVKEIFFVHRQFSTEISFY